MPGSAQGPLLFSRKDTSIPTSVLWGAAPLWVNLELVLREMAVSSLLLKLRHLLLPTPPALSVSSVSKVSQKGEATPSPVQGSVLVTSGWRGGESHYLEPGISEVQAVSLFFFFFNFFSFNVHLNYTLFNFYLFIYFWLCCVFVSVRGLSPVAASGGHSPSRCAGLSLSWPLLLRSTGSSRAGSVIVAHGPSCSAACGIFPDQGSNPCPLRWRADSQPLHH